MLLNAIYFVAGLVALYLGAGWLVGGAARIARRLGTRPVVVGLTVVAFGSSAPELLVGVVASVGGQSEVVLGNVIGSNILNIALILGVAALVKPLQVGNRLLSREVPLMVGLTMLVAALMLDRQLGRGDGLILLTAFVAFLWFVLHHAREDPDDVGTGYAHLEALQPPDVTGSWMKNVGLVGAGLAGLVVGAHLLVVSAVFFARIAGVSDVVIGLTVVAIGTSLPELATCVVAARRSQPEIALGNAVGSNIFNLLSILGISSLIRPIPLDRALLTFEIPAMVLFAVLLVPLAWRGRILGRGAGLVLLVGYLLFTALLIGRELG